MSNRVKTIVPLDEGSVRERRTRLFEEMIQPGRISFHLSRGTDLPASGIPNEDEIFDAVAGGKQAAGLTWHYDLLAERRARCGNGNLVSVPAREAPPTLVEGGQR